MGNFTNKTIVESDIKYQDDLVCILKPNVKKGILIFHRCNQDMIDLFSNIKSFGLKTGDKLKSENIDFGKSIYHPYIFFRAPYYPNKINYRTIDSEINSSFGKLNENELYFFIRVDPDKTFVFSSEIRVKYYIPHRMDSFEYTNLMEKELSKSKKTLSNYLSIIKENNKLEDEFEKMSVYNLYNYKKSLRYINYDVKYPYIDYDVSKNSEVLVKIPHLTPDYFVNKY